MAHLPIDPPIDPAEVSQSENMWQIHEEKQEYFDYTQLMPIASSTQHQNYSTAYNSSGEYAGVCNAFSKAPPPKQGLYIQLDHAFREW